MKINNPTFDDVLQAADLINEYERQNSCHVVVKNQFLTEKARKALPKVEVYGGCFREPTIKPLAEMTGAELLRFLMVNNATGIFMPHHDSRITLLVFKEERLQGLTLDMAEETPPADKCAEKGA